VTADLFHVTQWVSVEDIFEDGLRQHATLRALQRAEAEAPDDDEPMMMSHPDEVADRMAEEMIQEARYVTDVPDEYPIHKEGVFFWPTESKASRVADDGYGADPVVAVDGSKLPERCTCLIAPVDPLNRLWKVTYQHATDRHHLSPDEQKGYVDEMAEWWNEVEVYRGQNRRKHEIWCGCDVPPHAIEWIHDPNRDRRLYEPPEEGQSRLLEFGVDDD